MRGRPSEDEVEEEVGEVMEVEVVEVVEVVEEVEEEVEVKGGVWRFEGRETRRETRRDEKKRDDSGGVNSGLFFDVQRKREGERRRGWATQRDGYGSGSDVWGTHEP